MHWDLFHILLSIDRLYLYKRLSFSYKTLPIIHRRSKINALIASLYKFRYIKICTLRLWIEKSERHHFDRRQASSIRNLRCLATHVTFWIFDTINTSYFSAVIPVKRTGLRASSWVLGHTWLMPGQVCGALFNTSPVNIFYVGSPWIFTAKDSFLLVIRIF